MGARGEAVAGKHAAAGPRIRITIRAAVLLVVVTMLGVASVYPVRLFFDQRRQVEDLRAETQALTATSLELQAQVDQLRDPEYLEQLARACLGMVRRGEIAFVVVEKGGDPAPVPCRSEATLPP